MNLIARYGERVRAYEEKSLLVIEASECTALNWKGFSDTGGSSNRYFSRTTIPNQSHPHSHRSGWMHPSLARLVARTMSSAASTARSYAAAIDALNGLQSNAQVIDAIRKSGGKGGDVQLREQVEYMRRIGYEVREDVPS